MLVLLLAFVAGVLSDEVLDHTLPTSHLLVEATLVSDGHAEVHTADLIGERLELIEGNAEIQPKAEAEIEIKPMEMLEERHETSKTNLNFHSILAVATIKDFEERDEAIVPVSTDAMEELEVGEEIGGHGHHHHQQEKKISQNINAAAPTHAVGKHKKPTAHKTVVARPTIENLSSKGEAAEDDDDSSDTDDGVDFVYNQNEKEKKLTKKEKKKEKKLAKKAAKAMANSTDSTDLSPNDPVANTLDLVTKVEESLKSALTLQGDPEDIDFKHVDKNPANVQNIMRILPKEKFDALVPLANEGQGPDAEPYNYANFLKAAAKFPNFAAPGETDEMVKKHLAAMFAMFVQETGAHNNSSDTVLWKQGLWFYREAGCPCTKKDKKMDRCKCEYRGGTCDEDTWQAKAWPCPKKSMYFGRGAKQLSYNYNYGPFSQAIFNDPHVLLKNPDKVIRDGWLAFASAFWFYMTPQPPKPSMHDIVTGAWMPNKEDKKAGIKSGFGAMIHVLNGGLECGKKETTPQAANRISYYKSFSKFFKVDPGKHLDCADYDKWPAKGSAAIPNYWEQDWTTPGKCKLVTYQTPFSIFVRNSYGKCVESHFGIKNVATPSLAEALTPPGVNLKVLNDKVLKASEAKVNATGEVLVGKIPVATSVVIGKNDKPADPVKAKDNRIIILSESPEEGLKAFLSDPFTDVQVERINESGLPPVLDEQQIDLVVLARDTHTKDIKSAKTWNQYPKPILVMNPRVCAHLGMISSDKTQDIKLHHDTDFFKLPKHPWVVGLSKSLFRDDNTSLTLSEDGKPTKGAVEIGTIGDRPALFAFPAGSTLDHEKIPATRAAFPMTTYTDFSGQMTENGKDILRRVVVSMIKGQDPKTITVAKKKHSNSTDDAPVVESKKSKKKEKAEKKANGDDSDDTVTQAAKPGYVNVTTQFAASKSEDVTVSLTADGAADATAENSTGLPVLSMDEQAHAASKKIGVCDLWTADDPTTSDWCSLNCLTVPCFSNNCHCKKKPKALSSLDDLAAEDSASGIVASKKSSGICATWVSQSSTVSGDWCDMNCASVPCFFDSCLCTKKNGGDEDHIQHGGKSGGKAHGNSMVRGKHSGKHSGKAGGKAGGKSHGKGKGKGGGNSDGDEPSQPAGITGGYLIQPSRAPMAVAQVNRAKDLMVKQGKRGTGNMTPLHPPVVSHRQRSGSEPVHMQSGKHHGRKNEGKKDIGAMPAPTHGGSKPPPRTHHLSVKKPKIGQDYF